MKPKPEKTMATATDTATPVVAAKRPEPVKPATHEQVADRPVAAAVAKPDVAAPADAEVSAAVAAAVVAREEMPEAEAQVFRPPFLSTDGTAEAEAQTGMADTEVATLATPMAESEPAGDTMPAADATMTEAADGETPAAAEQAATSVADTSREEAELATTAAAEPAAATSDSPARGAVEEPAAIAYAPALAGIEVPSIEDSLLLAASAYHASDYALAVKVWQPMADAGVMRAQFHLGALYYEGRGVERDLELAYTLLRKAEMAGFTDARIVLALVEARLPEAERNSVDERLAAALPRN